MPFLAAFPQVHSRSGMLRKFATAERYLLHPKVSVHQAVLRSLVPASLPHVLLPDQPLQVRRGRGGGSALRLCRAV